MDIDKFRNIFARLPEAEKKLPIVKIDNRFYTWEECFREVANKTELGEKIYKKLKDYELI
jgi:hypothetical protein